jgi:hypothetical protein
MAVVQINPPGLSATSEGYVSSITVYTSGAPAVLVPNATTGQITCSAAAATQLVAVSNKQLQLISG